MNILRMLLHFLFVLALTALTQIGGLLWLVAYGLAGRWSTGKGKKKSAAKGASGLRLGRSLLLFLPLYALVSVAMLPMAADLWGKTQLPVWSSPQLKPVSLLYPFLNRHYVTLPTKRMLLEVAEQLHEQHPGAEVQYLDAGFPLFSSFPLLPHLSHSDGRKVDLAFFYRRADGSLTNEKPSRSGYGVFEGPTEKESAIAEECQKKGYWQYSYPQYLTMGRSSPLQFDAPRTQKLIQLLLRQAGTEKIFLEPHLKQRLGFGDTDKVGLGAARPYATTITCMCRGARQLPKSRPGVSLSLHPCLFAHLFLLILCFNDYS
jgi:hypothetical protein